MAVTQEIKSQLAKLLATEDLVVEHKPVETAQFNVDTRVLILPIWETTNDVYDMLVGHEVGHALYTPNIDWSIDHDINPSFVNIVEDARIEKLIKRRYAGISKSFYKGYKQLHEDDFFKIEGKDINEMSLADKINLYFKLGNFVDIEFTVEEMVHVTNIEHCETFEEVLNAAEKLYTYCKEELEIEKLERIASVDQGQDENEDEDDGRPDLGKDTTEYEEGDDEEEGETEKDSNQNDDYENEGLDYDDQTIGKNKEPEVETVDSLSQSLKNLANLEGRESLYVEIPKVDLDKIIISHDTIYKSCQEHFAEMLTRDESIDSDIDDLSLRFRLMHGKTVSEVDNEYNKFKRSAQKEVNYLVKEFECRKAASSYARASVSRTGVLDTAKLHTYRYNEDLFKKVTTLADGKNHGLVFILDWSGSMAHVMEDTIKQLFNLIWFCKKVQIPFDVYAFTNDYPSVDREEYPYEIKENLLEVAGMFSLLNLITSKVSGRVLEDQMKNIFRIASSFYRDRGTTYNVPIGLNLSGTPLNETMVALHQILPKFKKENDVEKVQCVILTDGEAYPLRRHSWIDNDYVYEPRFGTLGLTNDSYLRDRKLGTTYKVPYSYFEFTDVMLRHLRDKFTEVNFIGIRVMSPRDASSFIRRYAQFEEYEKVYTQWKKNKSFSIGTSGYHKYFGLSSNALSNDDEFEVQDDATKVQIKRAFVKSLKGKKMNKKVLGEFIELVA